MNYLLISILVLAALVVFIVIAAFRHQRRLGRHRGFPRLEFIRSFTANGVPSEIPAAVYDCYKSRVWSKHFSVAPDDDYEHVLSMREEDIDDDSVLLMKTLRLKLPADYSSMRADAPSVRTVRDMVLWLDWVRRHADIN